LLHYGPLLGEERALSWAEDAFRRALEKDPNFGPAVDHLIEVLALKGDTAGVRQFAKQYYSQHASSDLIDFIRWRTAVALVDSAELNRLRSRLGSMGRRSVERIVGMAQVLGSDLASAEAGINLLLARIDSRELSLRSQHDLALNRGRSSEASATLRTLRQLSDEYLEWPVWDALYWGGESAAAEEALPILRARAEITPSGDSLARRRLAGWQNRWRCVIELWNTTRSAGRTRSSGRIGPRLLVDGGTNAACGALVDALSAAAAGRPEADSLIHRADSLTLQSIRREAGFLNLAVARLREARGEPRAALVAVRRRPYHSQWGVPALATLLREEGRLAALSGDTAGALIAYEHYLTLRREPEPVLLAQRDSVQREMDRLRATGRTLARRSSR
jgi:hypothetical protein